MSDVQNVVQSFKSQCKILHSPILDEPVQAKELLSDVSTEALDHVRCRTIDRELVRDARRASDKGLVQGARSAEAAKRENAKDLVSDARSARAAKQARAKVLYRDPKRAIAKELLSGAMRAIATELLSGAMPGPGSGQCSAKRAESCQKKEHRKNHAKPTAHYDREAERRPWSTKLRYQIR